jgi:hypothetical protein
MIQSLPGAHFTQNVPVKKEKAKRLLDLICHLLAKQYKYSETLLGCFWKNFRKVAY